MKLAYLMPDWADPPLKGYQRIAFERLKRLSRRHEVDLFFFGTRGRRSLQSRLWQGFCREVHELPLRRSHAMLRVIAAAPSRVPFQVAYYRSRAMKSAVSDAVQRHGYDAMIVQTVRLAQYVPETYRGIAILDAVDPLPLSYAKSLHWRPTLMRWAVRREANRLNVYERNIAPRFSRILVVSPDDVDQYEALVGAGRIAAVPHGVDSEFFRSTGSPRQPGTIVLTGNLGYAPNVDAVSYFCQEILPHVLADFPSAELWLVGARPAREVRRWAAQSHVRLFASVPDVRPYLDRAVVSVCPVRHPVGVQTKILEAMAMGTPVVATRTAVAGLGDSEHLPFQTASTAREFAACVVALLRGEGWNKASSESRQYVKTRFSWEASVSILEAMLAERATGDGNESPRIAL